MGYVRTAEEIARFESYFHTVTMHEQHLCFWYDTTAEFSRYVLPPCFEVPEQPGGMMIVSLIRESYQGVCTQDEEELGQIWINAVHEGKPGLYTLTSLVSGDMQISTGREAWGMPKKRATSNLYDDGRTIYGYSERRGTRLLQMEAQVGKDLGPSSTTERCYEVKGWLKPDGRGLQHDPRLIAIDVDEQWNVWREGDPRTAKLTLTGTPEDPVDTIPIVGISKVAYRAGISKWTLDFDGALPDPESYRPYVYGRNWDDWTESSVLSAP